MNKPGKMLGELLGHLGRKPATELYPFERPSLPVKFRGRIQYDGAKCNGCKLCIRVCPAEAIAIAPLGDPTAKKFSCDIRLDRCIFCGQCVETCPRDALDSSSDFELAQRDKAALLNHME